MVTREINSAVNVDARMAALIVQAASRFHCRILIRRGNMEVNCKSIMGLVSMLISEGDAITVTVIGADEPEAADALVKMLAGDK
jgi:phosphotransferase system HPr (HPr) family protein